MLSLIINPRLVTIYSKTKAIQNQPIKNLMFGSGKKSVNRNRVYDDIRITTSLNISK